MPYILNGLSFISDDQRIPDLPAWMVGIAKVGKEPVF